MNNFWTDDLPKCEFAGAGSSNAFLKKTINDRETASSRCYFCKTNENTYLYAVFSDHNGSFVTELVKQKLADEILFGQLNGKNSDEEVKDVLRQAFRSAEKFYLEFVEYLLSKRKELQKFKNTSTEALNNDLKFVDQQLSVGTSVALCLIYNNKLYICNVGTCRVLLCKNDENKAPRVIQFSVDHDLLNEDEITRFQQIGLDIRNLRKSPLYSTRCIGCYLYKGGYKNCEILSSACSEPVLAQPEIVGGIPIEESFQFLLLLSSEMCATLQSIYSADTVRENKEIVRIVTKEIENDSNIENIAQSIVDKVIDSCKTEETNSLRNITLLLRCFHPLSSKEKKKPNQVSFNTDLEQKVIYTENTESSINSTTNSQFTNTNMTISSMSEQRQSGGIFDENRKIKPYVDFTAYYENVEKAKKASALPSFIDFD